MSQEHRLSDKGAKIALVCDRLYAAHEQIEDAWLIARGHTVASLADPDTRACTLELIEDIETLESEGKLEAKSTEPTEPTVH
jgi:hypothetical protein